MTLKTYHGSCHCGAVRFCAALDLADGIRRCNCTFCSKTKFWKSFSLGGGFELLAGEENLGDYRAAGSDWPKGKVHHYFCKTCGVRAFSEGYLDMAPFNGWFYAVNVNALDDVTAEEIIAAKAIYEDGLNDDWQNPPKETRHM
jgi:hypothetical protein